MSFSLAVLSCPKSGVDQTVVRISRATNDVHHACMLFHQVLETLTNICLWVVHGSGNHIASMSLW
jgi:hypothetical protein